MKVEKVLLDVSKINTHLRKLDIKVIECIVDALLNRHTYYKLNMYTYIFSGSKIRKKDIKSYINDTCNVNSIESVSHNRLSDSIITTSIFTAKIIKIPYIKIINTGRNIIVEYYITVFKEFFEDAVHEVVIMNDRSIIIRDVITDDTTMVQLIGFSIYTRTNDTIAIIIQ